MSSPASPTSAPIKVMLVDDSAVIRGLLARTLENDPEIKIVNSVSNGQQAIDTIASHAPDVVILDIEMPVMDGITALPKLIQTYPKARILMCSTLTVRNAEMTLKALSMGATDTIAKPTSAGGIVTGNEFKDNLVNLVKQIGRSTVRRVGTTIPATAAAPTLVAPQPKKVVLRDLKTTYTGKPSIVAIGSSTGGPDALFNVLKSCKNLDVPIVITQHMPATFTAMLAKHIEANTGIPAVEGASGMVLDAGKAYIAPGGFHMVLARDGDKIILQTNTDPAENFCRPAVDPMFRSVIALYGAKVLGVILTGMGQDGLEGAKKLVEAGGRLYAQDEATSVVWGMPGAVATAGICHAVVPLPEMGPLIRQTVMGR